MRFTMTNLMMCLLIVFQSSGLNANLKCNAKYSGMEVGVEVGLIRMGSDMDGTTYSSSEIRNLSEGNSYTRGQSQLVSSLTLSDSLVITEIMYNPPESGTDSLEFIEIYNPMSIAINMAGYYFSEGVSYTFGNYVISADGHVVVCKDSLALYRQFGVSGFEWSGALSNGGEDIVLKNSLGVTLDSVDYDDASPWPSNAGGDGPSIVLCDPTEDNNQGANWTESTKSTGKIINGRTLYGSPRAKDKTCLICPVTDSTFANNITCDSTQAGIFTSIYSGSDGCDSVHTVTNTFDPGDTSIVTPVNICDGDSVMIFGLWQKNFGNYYNTLSNLNGCDSVVVQALVVNPKYNNTLPSIKICSGDSALVLGEYESIAGMYYDSATTYSGCDSISVVELVVDTVIHTQDSVEVCNGDSIMIFGTWHSSDGMLSDTLVSILGCDSIHTVEVNVLVSDTNYQSIVTNNPGNAGVYDTVYANVHGCDSVVFYTVTYLPSVALDTLVITEIMYNSPESGLDSLEFIEVYNPMVRGVNLAGYNFASGVSYVFGDIVIPPGGYIVVCEDSLAMYRQFGVEALEWGGVNSLLNNGELIILKNATGDVLDSVFYDDGGLWPLEADGAGPSLVLCDELSDNALGTSWITSSKLTGDTIDGYLLKGSPYAIDESCGFQAQGDSLVIVTDSTWTRSTVTTKAIGSPWKGVNSLPALSTYTVTASLGQPKPWHTIDSVDGAYVIKTGNDVTFFRSTFILSVDTGVMAEIKAYMDDGMEIYINGHMIAWEGDRDTKNFKGPQHHLVLMQNGERSNGHDGDLKFDLVNNYRLDSVVEVGENELVIAMMNGGQDYETGGFSFRMDIKTGQPYLPALSGYIVSDIEWQQSTVTTPGGSSWNWPGIDNLPPSNTFTEPVVLGQPYGWYSTKEIEGSYAVLAGENVTYYRRRFYLVDTGGIDVRLRATLDENAMIYLNDSLLAGHYKHGSGNRDLPGFDVNFPSDSMVVNGFAGGDAFAEVTDVKMDEVLRKGDNYITVALQNRSGDKGGFSVRLDMDKDGSKVIRKSKETGNNQVASKDAFDVRFEVFPNPTRSKVMVQIESIVGEDNELVLSDVNGKEILRRKIDMSELGIIELNLEEYPQGVYFVRVRSGDILKVKPLLRF